MEENNDNADGTDKAHGKEIDTEETTAQGAVISELVTNHLLWHIPPHEDTRQHTTEWQHEVGRQHIAKVHQPFAHQFQVVVNTDRQRTNTQMTEATTVSIHAE